MTTPRRGSRQGDQCLHQVGPACVPYAEEAVVGMVVGSAGPSNLQGPR